MSKITFKKLTLLSLSVPLVAPAISCSTSWTKWKTVDDSNEYETTFPKVIGHPSQWQVRDMSILLNAWDASTETLDLAKINNHFELYELFGEITKLVTNDLDNKNGKDKIDQYWESNVIGVTGNYPLMYQYLQNVNKDINIRIKYKTETINLNVDLFGSIDMAIAGIETYTSSADKAYDVEKNGVLPDGTPVDLTQITALAAPLLGIDIVGGLMEVDSTFALRMAKLVNLPSETFSAFSLMIDELDRITQNIYTAPTFNMWASDVKLDLSISQTNGKLNAHNISTPTRKKHIYKGLFLTRLLG